MFRTSIFLPAILEERLGEVRAAREKRVGFAPLMADLLREAAIRGAAGMLADEGDALTARPIVTAAEIQTVRGGRQKARKRG